MAIAERLCIQRPPPEDIRKSSVLCNQIENGVNRGEDVSELLAQWNARASCVYEPNEFTTYYGAISTEVFVEEALLPRPLWIEDITFGELRDVLQEIITVTLPEALANYYLNLIEINLPRTNLTDLIYWPNEWFDDQSLLHAELTPDQILTYASMRSGRILPGAPAGVSVPYPIPHSPQRPQSPEQS